MKKVLLTGGTGFIGRNTICSLVNKGYEVHVLYSMHGEAGDDHAGVVWHLCNLFDPVAQKKVFKEILPTHLLHFAWDTTPRQYWTSNNNLLWIRAGLDLLSNFANYGGERAVMAGTCAEYDWTYGRCKENVTPLLPATLYGACKNSMQEIAKHYLRKSGISSAWGRIFFLYGPNEHPDRMVSSIIRSLLRGETAKCSHGKQVRDFLYVKDVAEAFVALLESDVEGAVNIASGLPVTLRDVINMIGEKIGRQDLIEYGSINVGGSEPSVLIADVEKLDREVAWAPQYDLSRGLDETIEWWKNN